MSLCEKRLVFVAAAVSEPEANERGSSLIGRTHFSSKRKRFWSKAQGILVMREWRIKIRGHSRHQGLGSTQGSGKLSLGEHAPLELFEPYGACSLLVLT